MLVGRTGSSNLLCSHSSSFTCSTQCHYSKIGLCNFSIYYQFVFPFVARTKLTAEHMHLQYELMLSKKKQITVVHSWPIPWISCLQRQQCTTTALPWEQHRCSGRASSSGNRFCCSTSCRRHIQAEDGHQVVMNLAIHRSLVTAGTLVTPLSMAFWFILAWTFKWQNRRVPSYSLHSRRVFIAW